MTTYTTAEKIAEIERELGMRKRFYPTMIARGTLSYNTAAHHLAVLKAIAEDYRAALPRESDNNTLDNQNGVK